jgi:hypothetical protein
MANRFLGEVTVEAAGKTWTLRCDFNAMCEFEEAAGKGAMDTFAQFEGGGASTADMRLMMWAFLRRHHPEVTLQEAGDVLSEDASVLIKVIASAMPDPEEVAASGKPAVRKKKAV